MEYKDIKEFNERCEEHPDHQTGMISERMIQQRLSEEIDELREYIEQRTWVDLTDDEMLMIYGQQHDGKKYNLGRMVQQALKEKNT